MEPNQQAFIVTGPTSGMGRAAALELAKHGTVVLVGRDPQKLSELVGLLQRKGQRGVPVTADLSDPGSARRAAEAIRALGLPIAGVLNNAGIMQQRPTTNTHGWDLTFATNHLGPFAFTEALLPSLADGTTVLFVGSAVEDPNRKPAVAAGFRGARFLSVAQSARGHWAPGGSSKPGMDAYATSKLATLASALSLSREHPRLRINAVEPGFNPATGLGGADAGWLVRFVQRALVPMVVPLLLPFVRILTTTRRAGRVLSRLVLNAQAQTGVYFDEHAEPMRGSAQLHDSAFQDRVVAETRAFLGSTGGPGK